MASSKREAWIIEHEVSPKEWLPITWLGPLLNEHDANNACQIIVLNPSIKEAHRVTRYLPDGGK